MGSAIIRTIRTRPFDVRVIELPHRWRAHQAVKRRGWQFAIVVVRALQANDHVALRLIVTNALDEATAVDVTAFERL